MRITKVNIPKDKIDNGLEAVKMDRLGQVVMLAGINGAGKTRLLDLIARTIQSKPGEKHIAESKEQIERCNHNIKTRREQISGLEEIVSLRSGDKKAALVVQIEKYQNDIDSWQKNVEQLQPIVDYDLIITDKASDSYRVVPFVPKGLNLKDHNTFRKRDIMSHAQQIDNVGVVNLESGTFARIQVIQDRFYNSTHQNSTVSEEIRQKAIDDYDRLKELMKIFLDTELDRNEDGEPVIFELQLSKANLSNGQKVLIQLCLAIHCQQESLKDLILFLDEPENHLHPSVIIETVDRIIKNIPNGQVWIATHSIPLLSYFDPSSIWFVDNNKVSFAGTAPEKVLKSLLGEEDRIAKLHDFISLPGIYALNRHAFESLFHPPTVRTGADDPQTLQIREEIAKHLKDDKKIRILDFGAGKGRLLANIIETNPDPSSNLAEWLDYVAYDVSDDDKDECMGILERIYDDSEKRHFSDFSKLFAECDRESFDIVVMCNVMHEIDPKQWLKLFGNKGEVPNLLTEQGVFLLVEDHEMPLGEKAYQKGFLVLDTQEIKILFNIKKADTDFGFSDARGDGRLKAHRIKKEYLTRITKESRVKAIEVLNQTAADKILRIRKNEINYKNGKKHGFWTQQFANSALALNELRG